MKHSSTRMPLRLRGVLLALSLAAMTTQVSGASAAEELAASRHPMALATAAVALRGGGVQLHGWPSLSPGLPVSGSWGLLVAGLMGVWAIGRRRLSTPGSRTLDPQRLRRP